MVRYNPLLVETFSYTIGGPALTGDLLNLPIQGKKGNLYTIFIDKVSPLENHLIAKGFTKRFSDVFDSLLIGKDYAVCIIFPPEHGLENLRQESFRPLSTDCLAHMDKVEDLETLFILKPLKISTTINLGINNTYLYPLLQIYTKAYKSLGLEIDEQVTKFIYKIRSAESFEHITPEGYFSFLQTFWSEPLTRLN